jgi:hypothetical protein
MLFIRHIHRWCIGSSGAECSHTPKSLCLGDENYRMNRCLHPFHRRFIRCSTLQKLLWQTSSGATRNGIVGSFDGPLLTEPSRSVPVPPAFAPMLLPGYRRFIRWSPFGCFCVSSTCHHLGPTYHSLEPRNMIFAMINRWYARFD